MCRLTKTEAFTEYRYMKYQMRNLAQHSGLDDGTRCALCPLPVSSTGYLFSHEYVKSLVLRQQVGVSSEPQLWCQSSFSIILVLEECKIGISI